MKIHAYFLCIFARAIERFQPEMVRNRLLFLRKTNELALHRFA